MLRALDAWDPSFRPWRDRDYQPGIIRGYRFSSSEAPFAVLGDYNGDGNLDAAIDGRTRTHAVSLVLLSVPSGYRVVLLRKVRGVPDPGKEWYGVGGDRREYGFWVFLSRRLPAATKLAGVDTDTVVRPRYECFEREYWGKASSAYYWDGAKFQEVITGD